MPSVHFVTFATPAFRIRQCILNLSAKWFGQADHIHAWTKSKLEADGFPRRHPELFPNSTGFGWYAWKPYIILKALEMANEGDLVIYQDTGRREPVLISKPLSQWYLVLNQHRYNCIAGVLIPEWGENRIWTKRSAFETLGLTGDLYEKSPQVQASWSVWRKCAQTEAFIRKWSLLCQDLELVGGTLLNGREGEVNGFQEHRWDQSLLTLLALKNHLPCLNLSNRIAPDNNSKIIDNFNNLQIYPISFKFFKKVVNTYCKIEKIIKSSIRDFKK